MTFKKPIYHRFSKDKIMQSYHDFRKNQLKKDIYAVNVKEGIERHLDGFSLLLKETVYFLKSLSLACKNQRIFPNSLSSNIIRENTSVL